MNNNFFLIYYENLVSLSCTKVMLYLISLKLSCMHNDLHVQHQVPLYIVFHAGAREHILKGKKAQYS
jgi:hypothetical protein